MEGARTPQRLVCFTCKEVSRVSEGERDEFGFRSIEDLKSLLPEYSSKRPIAGTIPGK